MIVTIIDTGACFLFVLADTTEKYFNYKTISLVDINEWSASGNKCDIISSIQLQVDIRGNTFEWTFFVMEDLTKSCILGIDLMGHVGMHIDFPDRKIVFQNLGLEHLIPVSSLSVDFANAALTGDEKLQIQKDLSEYASLFSDTSGLIHVMSHSIDTKDAKPVFARACGCDKIEQGIVDYHVQKTLAEGIILPCESPYASPVILCRTKNGKPISDPEALRFGVDYRKCNAVTQFPQFLLPHIVDLIRNIKSS